jgi:hypothetical protein
VPAFEHDFLALIDQAYFHRQLSPILARLSVDRLDLDLRPQGVVHMAIIESVSCADNGVAPSAVSAMR